MIYGHDKTIHRTGHVDVEVDTEGRVVSVWYRCQPLPFFQTTVWKARADEMDGLYQKMPMPSIESIELQFGGMSDGSVLRYSTTKESTGTIGFIDSKDDGTE